MLFFCEKCKQSQEHDVDFSSQDSSNGQQSGSPSNQESAVKASARSLQSSGRTSHVPQLPICPECGETVTYLGRESAVLSGEARSIEDGSKEAPPTSEPKHYETKKHDLKYLECKAFLSQNPNHIPSLIFMGLYHRSQGKYSKSIEFLEKAHALDKKNTTILRHLADIFLSVDKFEEAISSLLKIRTLEPDNYVVYKNLGIAHIYAGKEADGLMYFKWASSFCENEDIKAQLKDMVAALRDEIKD